MTLSPIGTCAEFQISANLWWPHWEGNTARVPPVVHQRTAQQRICMQLLKAFYRHMWLFSRRSGKLYFDWVNSSIMQHAMRISTHLHFQPMRIHAEEANSAADTDPKCRPACCNKPVETIDRLSFSQRWHIPDIVAPSSNQLPSDDVHVNDSGKHSSRAFTC